MHLTPLECMVRVCVPMRDIPCSVMERLIHGWFAKYAEENLQVRYCCEKYSSGLLASLAVTLDSCRILAPFNRVIEGAVSASEIPKILQAIH